jgi:hypothetical protein
MTTQKDKLQAVQDALAAYRKTGARELPSVRKSVPRAFLTAVDDLTAAIEAAVASR